MTISEVFTVLSYLAFALAAIVSVAGILKGMKIEDERRRELDDNARPQSLAYSLADADGKGLTVSFATESFATDSALYACGWHEKDGTLIEEVRQSADGVVVARSVNRVVEFDHRQ